jgi:hypothetical protein
MDPAAVRRLALAIEQGFVIKFVKVSSWCRSARKGTALRKAFLAESLLPDICKSLSVNGVLGYWLI